MKTNNKILLTARKKVTKSGFRTKRKKAAMRGMDELSSRFTVQNVVLCEPFVNRSLTVRYQKISYAVAIRYSGRCGRMAVIERLELELIHRTSAGTEKVAIV